MHRWAVVTHRTPSFRLKHADFNLVKSLFADGYLDRVEVSGKLFSYHLTDAGRAAVESFTAPKELT